MKIVQINYRLWSTILASTVRANIIMFQSNGFCAAYQNRALSVDSRRVSLSTRRNDRLLYKLRALRRVNLLECCKTNNILIKFIATKFQLIWQYIVQELKRYSKGFKLLMIEIKMTYHLLKRMLHGHKLTRRERRQFNRTLVDLFRLVPFSVFIIVPFMEFMLPIFLKLFPNMLPSTFEDVEKQKEKNIAKNMQIKFEAAKFLQKTLINTTPISNHMCSIDASLMQFAILLEKMHPADVEISNEEFIKFSSIYNHKSIFNSLNRPQLIALCKLADINTIGPNSYLCLKLNLKLRKIRIDDKLINCEGIENLNFDELHSACKERIILFPDNNIEYLRLQLSQWLDLHLNKHLPSSLLFISQALQLSTSVATDSILEMNISPQLKSCIGTSNVVTHVSHQSVG